jgi:hypothetical protein
MRYGRAYIVKRLDQIGYASYRTMTLTYEA